jgi:hypothetical protein
LVNSYFKVQNASSTSKFLAFDIGALQVHIQLEVAFTCDIDVQVDTLVSAA